MVRRWASTKQKENLLHSNYMHRAAFCARKQSIDPSFVLVKSCLVEFVILVLLAASKITGIECKVGYIVS